MTKFRVENINLEGWDTIHKAAYCGDYDKLLEELKSREIILIEDVCESHGAMHGEKKLGSLGWASNFSFYYAHHMSTIEGGMLCTDDDDLYQNFRMLRSHGLVRESSSDSFKKNYIESYPDLNPEFIFSFPAYNVRNTEIGGIIGRNQLNSNWKPIGWNQLEKTTVF